MVKISKKSKKPLSTHPKITAVILAIQDAQDHDLPGILNAVQYWHWPRTDLHYWIKPLNRFDGILEEICKSYNVTGDNVQVNEFTPRTKELILSIIRFTRLLLENATNRKLYSSFDRLNDLLLTQDLDILENALRLIFRRAQQIASNGPMSSGEAFNLTTERVADLTRGWKSVRQVGLSMYDIANESLDPNKSAKVEEVTFQFYRKASNIAGSANNNPSKETEPSGEAIVMTPVATPAPKSAKSNKATSGATVPSTPAGVPSNVKGHVDQTDQEGMTNINLGRVTESGKTSTDLLIDAMELYRIPSDEKLRLLQRIRVAMSMPDSSKRHQMLRIRLLAISVLIHTNPESVAESVVFLYEPDFVSQVADLVHPNKHVPMDVRTVALLALDTCSRIGKKAAEVTSALSVSVNHGTLMSILRKLFSDLHSDHPETTSEYVDALFTFLVYLQTTGFAGNMLLGAGSIPLAIELVKESKLTHDALLVANRAVTFLDNFTYSFPNAAAPFATAGGLQVFVQRVSQLVAAGVSASQNHSQSDLSQGQPFSDNSEIGALSHGESSLLKSLFRCLQRLMNSGQNTEGVRQLIDSSLVESCKLVMQQAHAFGPQNFALAITIMLTFVHNEPTSLTALQENKVPDAFYNAIRGEIDPSLDVLSVIPTAIGALCLNEAGLDYFQTQCLDIIDRFFAVFLSEKHARVLNDRENAVIIGANFDELVRHHPSLKQPVFNAVTKLLHDLYETSKDHVPESPDGYRLSLVQPSAIQASDQLNEGMSSAQLSSSDQHGMQEDEVNTTPSRPSQPLHGDVADLEIRKDDNKMLASIAVTGRFLEGFFSTPSHCKDYIKKDGLDHLLKLFTLPCIPFDVHHHSPYPGLTTVFLTISEHSPHHLLKALLGQAKACLEETSEFWQLPPDSNQAVDAKKLENLLQEMLSPSSTTDLAAANALFRKLVKAQLVLTIMSELHSTDAYGTRQPSSQILNLLRGAEETKALQELLSLHRACIYTTVKLKSVMPSLARPTLSSMVVGDTTEAQQVGSEGNEVNPLRSSTVDAVMGNAAAPVMASAEQASQDVEWSEAKSKNARSLKQVLMSIPDSLKSFLQGIMGLHAARRSTVDNQQRKDATFVAHAIAVGVSQGLQWPDSEESAVGFEYTTFLVKFLSDLLQGDRTSNGGLQLIFLKALDKQEGVERLISLYSRYADEVDAMTRVPEADRDGPTRLRLIHAVGGMKVLLSVYEHLTSHRTLLSPGHLQMLTQDKTSQSHFDPHTFLVKLRSRILPSVDKTWKSDFLASSPPIIVRAVFRILLQILEAQGESSDVDGASSSFSAPMASRAPTASPALTQSLVEMGFPRAACEQALIRRNNNLATAADYLMSHPEIVAAARAREEQEAAESSDTQPAANLPQAESVEATSVNTSATLADVDMSDTTSGRNTPMASGVPDEASQTQLTKGKQPSKKHSKADLDGTREIVKQQFLSRALALCKDHGELVFDIRDALKNVDFQAPGSYDASRGLDYILQCLVTEVQADAAPVGEADRAITAKLRLVALIFSDTTFRRAADVACVEAMQPVIALVHEYNRRPSEVDSRPKWLASGMLLAELVLARSDVPTVASQDEAESLTINRQQLLKGPAFEEERQALFNMSLDILQKGLQNKDVFNSTMRLLLLLTRRYDVAQTFVQKGGVAALLQNHDLDRKESAGFRELAIMILRHTMEDHGTRKSIISTHIQHWLSRPRRGADINQFVKELSSDASRDLEIFLAVTAETCRLTDVAGGYGIVKKVTEGSQPDENNGISDGYVDSKKEKEKEMQVDDLTKALADSTTSNTVIDTVMSFLITEVTTVLTAAIKPPSDIFKSDASLDADQDAVQSTAGLVGSAPDDGRQASLPAVASTDQPNAGTSASSQSLRDYTYATFLLSAISELVFSYTPCKASLMAFTKRKNDTNHNNQQHARATKVRSTFLHFLLYQVIPTDYLMPDKSLYSRKRFALSNQAIAVVLSLCNDNERSSSDSKAAPSAQITAIRKTVIDSISRAFKDCDGLSDSTDVKYGRIAALSVLVSRLLSPPAPTGSSPLDRNSNAFALQLAKLMLEKNYATVLTNALTDIDFNYPEVQTLLNAVLVPLESLTKLVTKLGRTTDEAAGETVAPLSSTDDLEVEEVDSDDEIVEDDGMEVVDEQIEDEDGVEEHEHEASDVYRNSALGMFQGELEPANAEEQYSSEGEMEEDMEEWNDAGDEMMEEEGAVPSDVSDETDNEDDEMDLPHDMDDQLDGEDDDDDDDSDSDEEEDEDDEDNDLDGDEHEHDHGDLDDLEEAPEVVQADLAAALRNGHLEPVDDFTSRILNEQMDLFGQPSEGGLLHAQLGDDGRIVDEEDDNLEDGGAPEGDDDDDEVDEDDNDGPPMREGQVAEMFQDLLAGGHGELGDPNIHVSVVGGPGGGGERILSIDIGGPPPASMARRPGARQAQAHQLGQHSLLTDSNEPARRGGRGDFMGNSRHRHRLGRHGTEYGEWVQSIEDLIGTGAGQLLEQVFGNMANSTVPGARPNHNIRGGPGEGAGSAGLLQNLLHGMSGRPTPTTYSRHRHQSISDTRADPARAELQMINEAVTQPPPVPLPTTDRWLDEGALFYGGMPASERITIITKKVTNLLVPEKQERDSEQRKKEQAEIEQREKELAEEIQNSQAIDSTASATATEPGTNAEPPHEEPATSETSASQMEGNATASGNSTSMSTTPSQAAVQSSDRPSWRERIERRRQAQANLAAESAVPPAPEDNATAVTTANTSQTRDELSEVLNLAARLSAVDAQSEQQTPSARVSDNAVTESMNDASDETSTSTGNASQLVVPATANVAMEDDDNPAAGPSNAAERVTIQIRGNTVDITDTGIDPTFLEALPDEMREEVLNQHFRETRAATMPTGQDVPSSINSEFLDALPPELRAEVLAQEALERSRNRQTDTGAGDGPAAEADPAGNQGMPMEIDPATFLASLDPQLRQSVLLEHGGDMLGTLPPDMLEEYRTLRTREMREHGFRRHHLGRRADHLRGQAGSNSTARRSGVAIKRDAAQVLEKPGVAALVRLLFFPPPLRKNTLANILIHLCENTKTRVEIVTMLLSILHDGTRENGAGGELVDRTFMAFNPSGYFAPASAKAGKTAKGRSSVVPSTPGLSASTPHGPHFAGLPSVLVSSGPKDNIPNLVVQRVLEHLAHLVESNDYSAAFFLLEQELPPNLSHRKGPQSGKRDKGKGRASEVGVSREKAYPITVLFSLLDRQSLASSPVIMEALTKLLANITVPLRRADFTKKAEVQVGGVSATQSSEVPNISGEQPTVNSASPAVHVQDGPKPEQDEARLLPKPPQLPPHYLKMVVNVLDLGECSSKMFTSALALINNLWLLPDARNIIATELTGLAQKYGDSLLGELADLEAGLAQRPTGPIDDAQNAGNEALSRFSQASSSQAKLLRVLKTVEYAKQQQVKALKKRRADLERRRGDLEKSKKAEADKNTAKPVEAQAQTVSSSDSTKHEVGASAPEDEPMETAGKSEEAAVSAAGQAQIIEQLTDIDTALSEIQKEEESQQNKVEELYDGFDFSPVWTKLSECLAVMEQGLDVTSNAGTLLPLIEAFLLVSSWGLEGLDLNSLGQDTPAMLPANRMRASLSPAAQAIVI